ncbi:MAG: hypothetical protein M1825_004835 [Sarcosagium campestre]|nr:MAG: hypothetical protein M1825_004835 [Sarcosagium campestre]
MASKGANISLSLSLTNLRYLRRSATVGDIEALESSADNSSGHLTHSTLQPALHLASSSATLQDCNLAAGTESTLSIDSWLARLPQQDSQNMAEKEPGELPASSASSASYRSISPSRIWTWSLTPRKFSLIACGFVAALLLNSLSSTFRYPFPCAVSRPSSPSAICGDQRVKQSPQTLALSASGIYNATIIPHAAFQPPEPVEYRMPDIIDTFVTYKYRSTCNISSLDLHAAFSPLCADHESLLTAMSSGGRIGYETPYMPRGCDMRWFTSEEVCEILSRFDKVIIAGDSMMRHVLGSINVLIRKDLGYGAVTDWNFSPQERQDCFCNQQFNVKACSVQGIYKTSDVMDHDPESVSCPKNTINVLIEEIVRFPIPAEEISRFKATLGSTKPAKPYAFIFGHGLWNDLDLQATLDWLDHLLDAISTQLPYLTAPKAVWPRLFLTPNAAGTSKPDEWIVSQGNKALMLFEEAVHVETGRRGVEHLGTWNMSVQSNKYDGV